MAENPNQPTSDDAVLSGQNPQPINAAVLGSIEGVKRRLASGDVAQRIAALPEALKYGQDGLELLMHGLKDESWGVPCAAYSLLLENAEPALKQALRAYNPYVLLKCLHTLTGHSGAVRCVAFSPDGQTIASGSDDKTIKLWDLGTRELRTTLEGHSGGVRCVAFSPDGQTIASHSDDKTITLWDAYIGELKSTITGHSDGVSCVAFSPDGQTIASCSRWSRDKTIKLWDVDTSELKSIFTVDSGGVSCVAFSPDGQTLACGSENNRIELWDVRSSKKLHTILLQDNFYSLACYAAFSPDWQTLVSSSYQTIKLWDVRTGELITTLPGHSGGVNSVAFSPVGQTIGRCSGDKTIKLWGVEKPSQLRLDPVEFFQRYVALKEAIKSGQVGLKIVIEALKDESWQVQEVAHALLKESTDTRAQQALQEYTLRYSCLEHLLAAQIWEEADEETASVMLKIADWEKQGCLRAQYMEEFPCQAMETDDAVLGSQTPPPINAADWGSLEGVKQRIASSDIAQRIAALPEALKYGQDGLELLMHALKDESWQVRAAAYWLLQENVEPELKRALQVYNSHVLLKCLRTLTGHSKRVKSVAFSPDGLTLASSSDDGTIKLWEVRTGKLKSTLIGHSSPVCVFAFSPDGQTLASSNLYSTLKLWDVSTGKLKSTLTKAFSVRYLAFSLDSQTLASSNLDNTIKLWDVGTGELKSTFIGHSNTVTCFAFSPDGHILATGSDDKTIKLWDVHTGELRSTLTGHSDCLYSVAFSPDGRTLASGSHDMTIKLWDVGTGELKSTLTEVYSVRYSFPIPFSPDGQLLASSNLDNTIKLWDVHTGEVKSTLTGHSDKVHSVAFSPDGQILVSGSDDKTIKLWDVHTGELKHTLTETHSAVSVAISRDGQTLASDCFKQIKLWGIENSSQIRPEPVEFFHRYLALKEALKSGQANLELVIQVLKDKSESMQQVAYSLLKESTDPRVKQALQQYTLPYTWLENLLAAQQWEEADEETASLMLKIASREKEHCLRAEDIEEFPCQALRTIDQLWVEYSNGHYGFSVQRSIWESVLRQPETTQVNHSPVTDNVEFEICIGWTQVDSKGADYHGNNDQFLTSDWRRSAKGYFPRKINSRFPIRIMYDRLEKCGI